MTPFDTPLSLVAEALEGSAVWAYMHGDVRGGDRLLVLAGHVEYEAAYDRHVSLGYERVVRHPGRSFGWLLAHDADVRARRLAVGVSVP